MEFLNNLKLITVIALSLALSAGLVDNNSNTSLGMMNYSAD
jgi:hypothetical protein